MTRLSYLLTITPRETLRLARQRLPFFKNGRAWTAKELMSSQKFTRGIRFAEFLMRQEAIAQRSMPFPAFDFEGKRVVEVGCGPLGGYGPLAIFRGAASFESAEPEWDSSVFEEHEIIEKYLRIFHADLVALYGQRMEFGEFHEALRSKMQVHRCGFEAAPIEGPVDIVLSQSVLEHVFPLEQTVAKLAVIQSAETRFLHLVDFGNHYPTADPFDGLYSVPPEEYIRKRGRAINLLRPPDIARMFEEHSISARVIPSRILLHGAQGAKVPPWSEKYDADALRVQLALVAGPDSDVKRT